MISLSMKCLWPPFSMASSDISSIVAACERSVGWSTSMSVMM